MSVNPEALGEMPDDAADHMKDVMNSDEPANTPERLAAGQGSPEETSSDEEGHVGQ